MESKITKRVEDTVRRTVREEFSELMSLVDEIREDNRNPQIIRQLVFETRVLAINKEYPNAQLPIPGFPNTNDKYKKPDGEFDQKRFYEDYRRLKDQLRREKMSDSTHDLNRIFNYNLNVCIYLYLGNSPCNIFIYFCLIKDLNSKVHRPLSFYNNKNVIVEAIESMLNTDIDDPSAANLPIIRIYKSWLNNQPHAQNS